MHNTVMQKYGSFFPVTSMMKSMRRPAQPLVVAFILISLTLLISSCQTTPQSENPIPDLQELEGLPPLLQLAFDKLPDISDSNSKIFVLNEASRSLVNQGDPELAKIITDNALIIARASYSGERLTEVLIELSRSYINAGVISRSIDLLTEALGLAQADQDSRRRGQLVQEIITVCFNIGSDALDLLRRAVQQIYIIEDYQYRAELLLDTARRYQATGEGQRSNTLLQQAIPAAGSISDPYARARAFSLLGLRFSVEGDSKLTRLYSQKAVDELQSLAADNRETPDQVRDQILSDTLINLSRNGFAGDALSFSNLISDPRLRLGALLETARSFYQEKQYLQADLVFERIFSILEKDDSSPELVISMLLNISQIYHDLGDKLNARIYVDATENYFARLNDQLQKDSLMLETAQLYARLDQTDTAEARARSITDSYYRSQALIGIAEILVENREAAVQNGTAATSTAAGDGTGTTAATASGTAIAPAGESDPAKAEIERILSEAAALVLNTEYLNDEAWRTIAQLYVRIGDLESALELTSRIGSAYSRALALVRIQNYVGLDDSSSARVLEIWRRVGR